MPDQNNGSSTGPLKSKKSTCQSRVQFENKTGRRIEVFWIDFDGKEVSFGKLDAIDLKKQINTFEGHVWICVDCETNQRLWLNSKEAFLAPKPKCARVTIEANREAIVVKRARVIITQPVRNAETLLNLCCGIISRTMNKEDIAVLPLPKIVKKELARHYKRIA